MKALLKAITRIYCKKDKGYELRLMAKMNEFLYILYTSYSHIDANMEKESKQIARLKGVLQYVAQSYQEPISLKTAADIASLNQEYFCRMFKRCMGVTFLEYINLVRIDHIHDELLVTDDSITDILERNGFTNYKVFSRMFKVQFGMTPRELRSLCEYKKEQQEYDTILELTDTAMEIYPFDEWQSVKIDALMGMNRYKEAYQLYDATSRMFFEELGITPSERMMNQFQEMSERMGRTYHAAGEIKEDLKEPEYEDGAFYCSLPSFRDNYRLVRRLIERNGQSAFLMVCSLTDGNGHPMENREKLDVMSMELHRAVKGSLRRGDSFSKYSPSQFLILLVGVNQENCDMIFRRIAGRFTDRHGSWNRYLEYYVSSIAEVENPNARLSFQKNEFHWK